MTLLKGLNAIVTGGSRGIGAASCIELAKEGANIAIIANQSLLEAEQVAKQVSSYGVKVIVVQCDVSDPDSVESMIQKVYDEFKQVDILVNNAGVAGISKAEEMSYKEWKRVIDINLTGVFLCAQQVGKRMIEQKIHGSIINISSICAHVVVEPDVHCHYNAAKGGVGMLTKSLAYEWAPYHIRVNAISPGYIKTQMTDNDRLRPIWAKKTALKTMGEPLDIASAVVYLASNQAKFVTGSDWIIDGGYTC